MGVNIHITLTDLQELFPTYNFIEICPTKDGVIDTTYIVTNTQTSYILKHFDRDISKKIAHDKNLLLHLHQSGLNVPVYVDEKDGWYLFSKLCGVSPKNIQLYHIQALARFMAHYHSLTYKDNTQTGFIENYALKDSLSYVKKNFSPITKSSNLCKTTNQKVTDLSTEISLRTTLFLTGEKSGYLTL